MDKKIIDFNKAQRVKAVPKIQAGHIVRVHLRVKEGTKIRSQVFEGLVIAVKGGQSSSPIITVRKISNSVGVEMILPVQSPTVEKIELVKKAKVRRAKLYYVRGLTAKQSRMKYKDISEFAAVKAEEEKPAPEKAEAAIEEKPSEEKTETAEKKESEK